MRKWENYPDRGCDRCKGPDVDCTWCTWRAWLGHSKHGTGESKMRWGVLRFYSMCDGRTRAKEYQLQGFRI